LYHVTVPSFIQPVVAYIHKHKLLKAGDRVGAAVSGGADSVAMLRLLLELRSELGIVLSVVHFNHKLRGAESDADEHFVAELAQRHELQFHCASGDVARHATEQRLSLETAARNLRYDYFHRLLCEGCVNRVATAHTLDDQAETVLMRITRGAGTRGLAGIYPKLSELPDPGAQSDLAIVRPLLGIRRQELEAYLKAAGQDWRQDSSNRDLRHARNRVRHGILPRLEQSLNPSVREALAETAEIARAEEEYWQEEVTHLLPNVWSVPEKSLCLQNLPKLPLALRRRVVRAAADSLGLRLEFRQVEEILEIASGKAKSADLPDGWRVSCQKGKVKFVVPDKLPNATDYEYRLPVPGEVPVPELGVRFVARIQAVGELREGSECLLDQAALGSKLSIRNWRAGDRFWPEHRKGAKKIKTLLQEKHLTGLERKLWPVVARQDEVVWLRGFPRSAKFCARAGQEAVLIQEVPLERSSIPQIEQFGK